MSRAWRERPGLLLWLFAALNVITLYPSRLAHHEIALPIVLFWTWRVSGGGRISRP
jgi:hypothetical protein